MDAFERPAWDGWRGPSGDPNDEQFGDVIRPVDGVTAGDADVLLVGEPYDGAVIGRRGAREGPLAIRRSLAGVKTHHFETGAIGDGTVIGDLGDVAGVRKPSAAAASAGDSETPAGDSETPGFAEAPDVATVQRRVREAAADVHALDALAVFLGGDNSLTVGNAAPLTAEDRLAVVNFDAHLDCRATVDGPSSGTPYRQLFEAGLDTYVCVGARHFETSTAYADYVAERGGTIVTAEAAGRDPDAALDRITDAIGGVDAVYVSVDVDVLDATAAPGVSAPTPGGLATRELFALVRRLASAEGDRLAGLEIVECAPPLDDSGRTSDAAARAVAHFLAGYLAATGGVADG